MAGYERTLKKTENQCFFACSNRPSFPPATLDMGTDTQAITAISTCSGGATNQMFVANITTEDTASTSNETMTSDSASLSCAEIPSTLPNNAVIQLPGGHAHYKLNNYAHTTLQSPRWWMDTLRSESSWQFDSFYMGDIFIPRINLAVEVVVRPDLPVMAASQTSIYINTFSIGAVYGLQAGATYYYSAGLSGVDGTLMSPTACQLLGTASSGGYVPGKDNAGSWHVSVPGPSTISVSVYMSSGCGDSGLPLVAQGTVVVKVSVGYMFCSYYKFIYI